MTETAKDGKKNSWMMIPLLLLVCLGVLAVGVGIPVFIYKTFILGDTANLVHKEWETYNDPRGFSMMIPKGWKVQLEPSGMIMVGENEAMNGPVAFFWTLMFNEPQSNNRAMAEILPAMAKNMPGLTILNYRELQKYGNGMICRIQYGGKIGAMMLGSDRRNFFISGAAGSPGDFAKNRPDLLRILSTFRFSPAKAQPEQSVPMTVWRDPTEGAFTVNIPQGWTASGGVVRPYQEAGYHIKAMNGSAGIEYFYPLPPMFTVPNSMLEWTGFHEGSRYNSSNGMYMDMIVMHEMSAAEYIQSYLPRMMNLQVQSITNKPDLAKQFPQMPMTSQITAAEAIMTGDGLAHKVSVVEQGTRMGQVGIWMVIVSHYWASDEKALVEVEKAAKEMGKSFKLDPQWAAHEQQEFAKRTGIRSRAQAEISGIISSTLSNNSDAVHRSVHDFTNAIRGVDDYTDPGAGKNYEVPLGANHYWSDGYNIVGTQTEVPPTYQDDWTELIQTRQK